MIPDAHVWQTLSERNRTNSIPLDCPKGTAHPRYPDLIYPLEYGYLENTSLDKGDGIDVWMGSRDKNTNGNLMHI